VGRPTGERPSTDRSAIRLDLEGDLHVHPIGRDLAVLDHALHALHVDRLDALYGLARLAHGLDFIGGHVVVNERADDLFDSAGVVSDEGRPFRDIEDDFDAVIFAGGLEDFADIVAGGKGEGLPAGEPKAWHRALGTKRQTAATAAAQVWLANNLGGLGWHRGPAIVAALGSSFDTWADMTHTLPSERAWRRAHPKHGSAAQLTAGAAANNARSVAYFCAVLADEDVRTNQHLSLPLRKRLAAFLAGMTRLWPGTARDWRKLKPLRFHVQANVAGSDRYSLSLPGTISERLSPFDRSVLNMTVAGDWTACGLDAGCVEAAVMSGMLAAHAISETPALDSIIGYDHP